MVVRKYTESDRPFLRTLFLASRKAMWTWLDAREWRLEDFDRVTRGETVLVAESAGKILGFASIFTQENFLHSLFVDPDAQGQGVGSALLRATEATFTSTGSLKCLSRNQHALAFYKKHGWEVVTEDQGVEGDYCLMHLARTKK
ncbi:GNAT family N-acetyltransferase [Edaphovirga cremea]|uniref:GNAT family N-acetyltransferase n=1 Tax=Edaphovirga cremea TaxID=2267246 RepID=UPI000DEF3105|nr:GNAT family N-acetyltransferase [Edaphovirga cremea]